MDQFHQPAPSSIVIIGSGLAGYTVIREIRKLDKAVHVTLITKEPGYSYSKPMLSTALASNKGAQQLISANSEAMATQLEINSLSDTEVSAIDTATQVIETPKGKLSYGKLVLCLGADQIRLPLHASH